METKIRTLSNGITVINVHRKESLSSVIKCCFLAGSKHEREDNIGVAHFLEHMLFKGTDKMSALDIAKFKSFRAIKDNAETSFDDTIYYANCINKEVNNAFYILSEMINNSIFDKKEIAKERKAIVEEARMYMEDSNDVDRIRFEKTLFADEYIKFQQIGNISDVNKINHFQIVDFYNQFYTRSNLVIVSVGGVSFKQTIDLTNKYFSDLPLGVKNTNIAPIYKGGTFFGPKKKKSYLVSLAFDATKVKNKKALVLMSSILGADSASRLFFNIREDKGLVYNIHSHYESGLTPIFSISAHTAEENIRKVITEICNEIKIIAKELVTQEELEKAKNNYRFNMSLAVASNFSISNIAYEQHLYHGKTFSVEETLSEIDAINEQDILEASFQLFTGIPTYFISGNAKNRPSRKEVEKMLKM